MNEFPKFSLIINKNTDIKSFGTESISYLFSLVRLNLI